MRRQKRIWALLLSLALLCGLAVPTASAAEAAPDTMVPSASVGDTVIHDSSGYEHTLSNPILYTFMKGDFDSLPKAGDFYWDEWTWAYESKHEVYAVPVGTVIRADAATCFWDCMACELELRNGTWYRWGASQDIDTGGDDGLSEFTFSKSNTYYRCYFTFKNDHALYTDTVYFYTPGEDAAFKAPASYKSGEESGSNPTTTSPTTPTTPSTPSTPTAPAVTPPASGTKESPVTADPNAKIQGTDNSGLWNYDKYGKTMMSYLYQRSDGLLTRVELKGVDTVVEVYDQDFQILSSKEIPKDSSLINGGFFAGENYNFLIFGQRNTSQSDSQEVVRVMKYSKDWEFLGSASLKGANTTIPFHSGSLRCAESNGFLYIRTCHEMYRSSDGLNHQSNMNVIIRQDNMEIIQNPGNGGYVSHSFNQFIIAGEDGTIVTLDHGDAYPRAAVLQRYQKRTDGWLNCEDEVNIQEFPGQIGDNETNASLGGLAESSSCYLAVGNLGTSPSSSRDIMLYSVNKSNFSSGGVRTVKLASYIGTSEYGATPQIVKLSNDRFLVLWNVLDGGSGYFTESGKYKLSYVFVDGSGNPVGQVRTGTARRSDCQPILYNGKVVWYAATIFDTPTFYAIDVSTGTLTATKPISGNPFTDVPDSAYYHDAVLWALKNGVTTGVTADQFQPKAPCTRGQVVTFLWRAMGSPEPKTAANPFTDVPSSSAFYKAILWAYENQITSGNTPTTFNPQGTCTSGHVVTFLWRAENQPAAAKPSALAQSYPDMYYTDAVAWADSAGLLTETGAAFNPSAQATRADIITYLYRDMAG